MTHEQTGPADLRAAVDAAHHTVASALDDPEQHGATAVAWCSAHLAAVDAVLYGAASRRVVGPRTALRAARHADHALQQAANRLDRRLTGDTHLDHVPVEAVAAEVRDRLADHRRAEGRLVSALSYALPGDQLTELGRRLTAATTQGPTRPHPHTHHTPLSALVSRVDAIADRVRDALDNRVPATGRPVAAPRPLGRWGRYLMGAPSGPPEQQSDAER